MSRKREESRERGSLDRRWLIIVLGMRTDGNLKIRNDYYFVLSCLFFYYGMLFLELD